MKRSTLLRGCLLAAMLVCAPVFAQGETLVTRVIVMRHGVRSPTSSPEELAPYANRPWTAWPVAPGVLTEHGAQGMTSLGQRFRRMLVNDGLGSGKCDDAWLIIADSTPRNRGSGAALAKGLQPECHASYLALPPEQNNALFHFNNPSGAKDDDAPVAAPSAWPPPALVELQTLLLGCNGEACLADAREQQRKLLLDPAHDDAASRAKALKSAGSLSENLMLEYAQGVAPDKVAWGKGDAATIGRIITLHNLQFALAKKSMPSASNAGSNLLAHVMATLQQSAGMTTGVAPLSPKGSRAVLLVGHDTNLANLAGVLGVDWHDTRQPDDYPPGGALVFDLVKAKDGYGVRVSSWMPTLEALRQADLSGDAALVRHALPLAPCPGKDICPLATVDHWLKSRLDPASIDATVPAMPVNQL
ncbi:histidine-type phosphatase [Dyella sp. C11]|uniref:histidine-type phosphatase n=1 Tax=Dyella sp. C11 TaxID=2126991 RepID=UPI000D6471C2|nr:histidine-type phosphatase [Dyella sp. C11]